MNFTCSHCGKLIDGLSISIDNEILHRECEGLRIKPISLELSEHMGEVLEFQEFMYEKFWEYSTISMMIPKEIFNE